MKKVRHQSEHSGMVVNAVAKVLPAVVSIAITKHLSRLKSAVGNEFWQIGALPPDEIDIPPELIDARGMVRVGGGSGFFVREDGIILTNRHVLADRDAEYTVVWQDKSYACEILVCDPINDVAILRIERSNVPVVRLGSSEKLEFGETVIAIGNALGDFANTVSAGIISGLSRYVFAAGAVSQGGQELRGLIQTDAAINPGNSGGPLINLRAEAIAINTAVISGAENIGFAIPIDHAKRDLDDLVKYGRVRKPFLGVRYILLNESLKIKHNLPFAHGAYVLREAGPLSPAVVDKSPAAVAGIREGDVILECNGVPITSMHTLQDGFEGLNVGDIVSLKVWRKVKNKRGKSVSLVGKQFKVKVKLAERK